jgi:hypothetical protein
VNSTRSYMCWKLKLKCSTTSTDCSAAIYFSILDSNALWGSPNISLVVGSINIISNTHKSIYRYNCTFTLGHVSPKMSACLQFGQKTPTGGAWVTISAGL